MIDLCHYCLCNAHLSPIGEDHLCDDCCRRMASARIDRVSYPALARAETAGTLSILRGGYYIESAYLGMIGEEGSAERCALDLERR